MLSLGKYPEISLEEARRRCDEARNLLAHGIDPSEVKKKQKAAREADQHDPQKDPARFMLDDQGALSFRLDKRSLYLTAKETAALRVFLEATKGVRTEEAAPCR